METAVARNGRPGVARNFNINIKRASALDIGCGDGQTVALLRRLGYEALGVDEGAESLPFGDAEFDLVMLECVLSVLKNPLAALREARRVLTRRGKLIISDVFGGADAPEAMKNAEAARALLSAAGLSVEIEEDHTAALVTYAAERGVSSGRSRRYILFICKPTDPLTSWLAQRLGSDAPSRALLEEFQLKNLRETLTLAAARSRFYRERLRGLDIAEIASRGAAAEILRELPFSYPEELRAQPLAFLCGTAADASRVVTLGTSGTTGGPKRVFFSADELESTVDFFDCGMRNIASPGGRVMIFMRGAGVPDGVCDTLTRGLSRFGCEGISFGEISRGGGPSSPEAARRALLESGADCAVGIAAQMLEIASLGGTQPRLKTVLLSADNIPAQTVRALENAWGCEVFSHFGMTETCFGGAVDCPEHAGMHIREPDMIFEIIDPVSGESLPDGERGEIVLTTLSRRCMPLIRYRTGDFSRVVEGECPCGCLLRRLDEVEGHA
jgi:phenylacetate-coenzyme A ligase PaaK-like adenylate-forming protein